MDNDILGRAYGQYIGNRWGMPCDECGAPAVWTYRVYIPPHDCLFIEEHEREPYEIPRIYTEEVYKCDAHAKLKTRRV